MLLILLLFPNFALTSSQYFKCPERCQCYEDNEQKLQVHLICKFEQLNTTIFQKLQRPELVRTLTIRCPHHSPKLSTPTPGLFQGLINLDRLEIDRCQLEKIPNSIFAGLPQLISLIVKNAKIRELPAEVFAYIPKLMTLDLSGNRLRIEPYSIRSLSNLIHLDLSDNEIGFLTNTFIGLIKLKVITMNNNRITNIDFRRFPENLTDLSMRHNLISNIHYSSGSARNLKRLDLAGNNIEFIASKTSGNVNVLPGELKHIDLSSNRLKSIYEGSINHLKHLVLLDLKNNTLKEIRLSSLRGSKQQMKVFLSNNPLGCHCSHRWMTSSKGKNITVADLTTVTCTEIVKPYSELQITLAESRNLFLCKYSNMCEADCDCCDKTDCKCQFQCPDSCQCWRSSDTSNIKTAQNVISCDNLRFDKLGQLPTPLTKLFLNNTNWRVLESKNLSALPFLKQLSISNSKMMVDEVGVLTSLKSLTHLEISSSALRNIPKEIQSHFPYLSHLDIHDNPIFDLKTVDLEKLNSIKKLKIGGNSSRFNCDCQTPSDFQRWLNNESNRAKIEDFDQLLCNLNNYGVVWMGEALAGTNESVCLDPTNETKQWMEFVENVHNSTREFRISSMSEMMMTRGTTLEMNSTKTTTMTTKGTKQYFKKITTMRPIVEVKLTTPPYQKTYIDYEEDEPHKFVNILIFILFICVIILILSIAVTVYFKFFKPEEAFFHRRKKMHLREEQPLHTI